MSSATLASTIASTTALNCTFIVYDECVQLPLASTNTMEPEWMKLTYDAIYYVLPVIFTSGLVFAVANVCIVLHKIQLSSDLYLLGLGLSEVLLLVVGALLQLPRYIGHHNTYQYYYGPLMSLHSWFWYTTYWMLIVTALDQCIVGRASQARPATSNTQALLVTVLVYAVCLVSALPQFWAYTVTEAKESTANHKVLVAIRSTAMDNDEYNLWYFWYRQIIVLFLPYPLIFMTTLPLCSYVQASKSVARRLYNRTEAESPVYRKRQLQINSLRLCVCLNIMYLVLTLPYTAHMLIADINSDVQGDPVQVALNGIFLSLFYLNYAIHFIAYCAFYDKYRNAAGGNGCCRSKHEQVQDQANMVLMQSEV